MKARDVALTVFLLSLVVSILPLWKDPYYHKENVDFWTWLKRELVELKEGEKE